MKKFFGLLAIGTLCCSTIASPTNITKVGVLGGLSDNQTSPGCISNNQWDLESFLMDGTKLSLVSTFDQKNGVDWSDNINYALGDIFIDLDGNAQNYFNQTLNYPGTFKNNLTNWDYAIKLDYSTLTYTQYALTGNSNLYAVNEAYNQLNSNGDPYRLKISNEVIVGTGSLSYVTGLADNSSLGYTSFESSTTHNMTTVDIGSLLKPGNNNITAHVTMLCGNDIVTGKTSVNVPEPSIISIFLLGFSMLSVGLIKRPKK